MITAGIDMGAKTIKVVVLRRGEIIGRALAVAGLDAVGVAGAVMDTALLQAGVTGDRVQRVVATGTGRQDAPAAHGTKTDVGCAALAASRLFPKARTVVDVGAEQGRAIRVNNEGRVMDFAINEKCAAGTGSFTEAMARALEVPLEELGALSLQSTRAVPMNAHCAVFAESDVVSMIHSNVARPDMARAVHDAMASRVAAMVRRVGCEPPVVLLGGMAKNTGFVDSLRRCLELDALQIPDDPEVCGALGAALAAAKQARS